MTFGLDVKIISHENRVAYIRHGSQGLRGKQRRYILLLDQDDEVAEDFLVEQFLCIDRRYGCLLALI